MEYFRNSVRTANAEKSGVTHGAFPSTFQGQKLDGKTSDGKEEKSTKPCLCGLPHKFKTCWYLMESLRLATWKPNKNIQQQIEEKLEKSAKLREIVERIRKQVTKDNKDVKNAMNSKEATPEANFMVSAFNSGLSDYKLHQSVILDSGAILHVCND